jgi:hypothetical protein
MKTMLVVAAALVAAILVSSLMSTQRIAYAQNGLTQTESEQIEEAENWPTQTEMEPEDSQITIGLPDFEFP